MSKLLPLFISDTGLSEHDVLRIVRDAPIRYKTYRIPKRTEGTRVISQPARELKALQRILTAELLSKLPVHPAATAYRPGVSIRANAAAHAPNGPILKYDFKDFFPSITSKDWRNYCENNHVFDNDEDLWISTNILFQKRRGESRLTLAIGAPYSPSISNILMRDFDSTVSALVAKDYVTYTRYADDLTFSARRTGYLTVVDKILKKTLRDMKSPSLTLNPSKTAIATTKYKRFVTGLVLTNDGAVSLGHDRKRKIRATVHHVTLGKLSERQLAELAGMLAFVNDVEPQFLAKLERTYGVDLIQKIKTGRGSSKNFDLD